MREDENKKKKLIGALAQLAGSIAFPALVFWLLGRLESRGIVAPGNPIAGYAAAMLIIPAMVTGFRAAVTLVDVLAVRDRWRFNAKFLLIGAILCALGVWTLLDDNKGEMILLGAGLLLSGLLLMGLDIYNAVVLHRTGKTVFAEITEIEHGAPRKDGSMSYTVTCRADGKVFTKRTDLPMDASYIGRKVAVLVSSRREDVYDVDLSRTYLQDRGTGEASPPETEPETESEASDAAAAPAQPETPEGSRSADHADFTPMDWETARKQCLKIPWPMIVFLAVALLYFIFLLRGLDLRSGMAALYPLLPLALAIWLLRVVLDAVKRYRLFRFGRQVRARIGSAGFVKRTQAGDPVYKVSCRAGDEEFTGKMSLRLEDPRLTGKWVTVFVSRRFPKLYLIEGTTLGEEN